MDAYFLGVVSFITLLFLAGIIFVFTKKIKFPYTIALVGFGIFLGILAKIFPVFNFLISFELTKETLLYIFLPVLLFESAYNIRFREIIQHTRAISLLAVVSLLISAVLSAFLLYFILNLFGISVPFIILLAFGTLISATDPVSVLALFKEMWAPKRLTLIFEGESLFNDGTALALFLVILSILIPNFGGHDLFSNFLHHILPSTSFGTIILGFFSFLSMIIFGFVIGGFIGLFATRSIPYIRKYKLLEITLTIIIAHFTFLFSEFINHFIVPVSAVIATTISAIVMGNYGRYKLSSETRHIMGEYWEFFAFVANSMVFLLVGVMIVSLNIAFTELWLPIILSVIIVAVSRAISVYWVLIPLNFFKKEFIIPKTWMHLLSWGSLRGGLAIIMVLFIPADFSPNWWVLETSVRDFILALTVGCIIFTTFVKALTIPVLIKKLHIADLSRTEDLDFNEWKLFFLTKSLARIQSTASHWFFSEEEKQKIEKKIQAEILEVQSYFQKNCPNDFCGIDDDGLSKMLALHAIEMEKSLLVYAFNHDEVPEWILRHMLNKMDSQIERIEEWKAQLKSAYEHKIQPKWLQKFFLKIVNFFSKKRNPDEEKYYKARTRAIILEKVLKRLEIFHSIEPIASFKALKDIENLYKKFLENAINTRKELYKKPEIQKLEKQIVTNMLEARKYDILEEFSENWIISMKTKNMLIEKYNINH